MHPYYVIEQFLSLCVCERVSVHVCVCVCVYCTQCFIWYSIQSKAMISRSVEWVDIVPNMGTRWPHQEKLRAQIIILAQCFLVRSHDQ